MSRRPQAVLPLFALTLLCSAVLLFIVEPMFAKMVLPLLGSTPAVWNTSVLFFQTVLLAGYAYAHLSIRFLSVRQQVALHMVLLCIPVAVLPLRLPASAPPSSGSPVPWLLLVLAVSVGLPFFVVSATSPLLQSWFSVTGHEHAADPYFLYRASNFGSMLALLGYPVLIEPNLPLLGQSRAWTAGYGVVAALLMMTAMLMWRVAPARRGGVAVGLSGGSGRIARRRWLRWVALAAVPSTWMLALTSYLTTGVAPVPLLWVIPLALYLLSFTIVFAARPLVNQRWLRAALPLLIIPLVGTLQLRASGPLWFLATLHVATFFVAALVCHGELAGDRPEVGHLTVYYLWLAIGGVAGGAFAALLAPAMFTGFTEYPVAIICLCLLVPLRGANPVWDVRGTDLVLPAVIAVVVVSAALIVDRLGVASEIVQRAAIFGPAAVLVFAASARPVRFGLAVAALLVGGEAPIGAHQGQLFGARDFFGVNRVTVSRRGDQHILYSGNIVHGAQNLASGTRDEPLTYYSRAGPLGDIFRSLQPMDAGSRVSVIGLGAGSMACYARPGQRWTFFELDPMVARIAADPSLFTFMRDCDPHGAPVVLSDGRLSVASLPAHSQDMIVVDAFGSDVIPVHLVTREAIALYRSKLTVNGIIVLNVSNQFVDLRPVLARQAEAAGMVSYVREDGDVNPDDIASQRFPSTWMVLSPTGRAVGNLPARPGWVVAGAPPGTPLWTDDFSNIFGVLRWH